MYMNDNFICIIWIRITEGQISYFFNTFGDNNVFKRVAVTVFATYCVLICFD